MATALTSPLDDATTKRLIDWFAAGTEVAPRQVWPAQITLASDDVGIHAELLSRLRHAAPPAAVVESAMHAWLFQTPRYVLAALLAQLRDLVSSPDSDTRQIRARLEGRVSDTDASARSWIEWAVLRGKSPRIASTAVKTIEEARENGSFTIDATYAKWLSGLLATKHEDACARVARLLHSPQHVVDAEFRQVSAEVRQAALARLRSSVRDAPEPQLFRALLEDIVRSSWVEVVDKPTVLDVWELTARRAVGTDADPSDRSAALHDLGHLSGTLVQRSLEIKQSRQLLTTLLSNLRLDPPRSRARKAVSSMVVGWIDRDPDAGRALDDLFFADGAGRELRRAIVDALLARDVSHARRLTESPQTPDDIVSYLLSRLPR